MQSAGLSGQGNIRIALVVAAAENGVIGRAGRLPWRLPSDLKVFREITLGKPVIMGRKTFQSIGKPLDRRTNIVITRDPAFRPDNVTVAHSLEEALCAAVTAAQACGADEIMVIGGADIFRDALDRADRIYLTRVHGTPEGDVLFPPLRDEDWRETGRRPLPRTAGDEFASTLVVLDRER